MITMMIINSSANDGDDDKNDDNVNDAQDGDSDNDTALIWKCSRLSPCGHPAIPDKSQQEPFPLIKENKEIILQLGANMKMSYLRPHPFPVHEATLETLCFRSYTLFHMFRDKKKLSLLPRYYGL